MIRTNHTGRSRRRIARAALVLGVVATSIATQVSPSGAQVFDSIYFGSADFPLGLVSFADQVVSYTPVGDVIGGPSSNPNVVVGWQTQQNVSLGDDGTQGGQLVVEFTDNVLVDQNVVENGNDLYVFEAGAQIEAFTISVSADGLNWLTFAPTTFRPSAIDLATNPNHVPGTQYRYVKIDEVVDGSSCCGGQFSGADIMAIGAIGAQAVDEPVGALLPAIVIGGGVMLAVLGTGTGRLVVRRRREPITA